MAQILVVDDSETVRNEVRDFLISQGYDIVTANDGKDGLNKISQDNSIQLIISDVNMPNMDGLTMVEKVREKNKTVNILMLTTESDPKMKQRGKNAGVKGWIVKPFKGPSVINGIKQFVS